MARPTSRRTRQVGGDGLAVVARDRARVLAPKLRALADETRLTLLLLLAQRPRTVKELQEATGLSQALVSHHLAPLREQELVTVVAKGRSNQYTLCCSALAEPMRMFATLADMDPAAFEAFLGPDVTTDTPAPGHPDAPPGPAPDPRP